VTGLVKWFHSLTPLVNMDHRTRERERRRPATDLAANLMPDKAAEIVTNVDATEDAVITFDYWKATDGMTGFLCFDEVKHCALVIPPMVQASDREWRHAEVLVPKGTKKIIFGAVNQGPNIGPIGIDNVRLAKNNGGKAGDSRCTARKLF